MAQKEAIQSEMFDTDAWKEHWHDMPEYSQEDEAPFRTIFLHFPDREAVKEFAELIGQKIHPKEPSYWYPAQDLKLVKNKRYVDGTIQE